MKRLIVTGGILGLSVATFALGTYFKVAQETYNFPQNSPAANAKCMLCHTTKIGGRRLNQYGMDLKAMLKGSKRMTPTILKKVEDFESSKNRTTYGAALRTGKIPG